MKYRIIIEKKYKTWLKNTDWMAINWENVLDDTKHAEILAFRQAIRDINKDKPATETEKEVKSSDHTTWKEPELLSWLTLSDLQD